MMPRDVVRSALRWVGLSVEPQWDSIVDRSLEDIGREHYRPIEVERFVRRGRPMRIERSFFPGYVLARIDITEPTEFEAVLAVRGVADFVRMGRAVGLIQDEEVKRIRDLENARGEIPARVALGFKRNDFVRVTDGPFSSFTGVVGRTGMMTVERVDDEGFKSMERVPVAFVEINIFGRRSPTQLFQDQIEHA